MIVPAAFSITQDLLAAPPCARPLLSILPLGGRHSLSVATGRSALMAALATLDASEWTGRAWLPSLCCSSLAPPLLRRGLSLRFYPWRLHGEPPDVRRGDLFLYIHFCGLPNRRAEDFLNRLPDRSRPTVIEDCVHALFTSGTGRFGDFALYSFRKFLPVPDGGLLLSRQPIAVDTDLPLEAFVTTATLGRLRLSPELLRRSERILDDDGRVRAPSEMGRFLLDRAPWEHIPEARRTNARTLARLLGLPAPPDEAVPLGLPVRTKSSRAELERGLRAAGYEPPLSWDGVPGAEDAETLAVLPCDERMRERDLERVAAIAAPSAGLPFEEEK